MTVAEIVVWVEHNADTLTGVGTILIAIFTYLAARAAASAAKDQHNATAINVLLGLDARFGSPEMVKYRRLAAQDLRLFNPANVDAKLNSPSLDVVLDFLEVLGWLYKTGALPEDALWSMFHQWVSGYYMSAKFYIDEQRERDPTNYCDLVALAARMQQVQSHRNPNGREEWSVKDRLVFLRDEEALS